MTLEHDWRWTDGGADGKTDELKVSVDSPEV